MIADGYLYNINARIRTIPRKESLPTHVANWYATLTGVLTFCVIGVRASNHFSLLPLLFSLFIHLFERQCFSDAGLLFYFILTRIFAPTRNRI